MKLRFLGTGTSHGIPVIACKCKVCTSKDPHDRRNRCSAWIITEEGKSIVVDTGPEFRIQALTASIDHVDAVFLTHSHADHINGLDDLRVFSHTRAVDPCCPSNNAETEGEGLPIYANAQCIIDTFNRFDYIFTPVKEGGGKPKLHLIDVKDYSPENPVMVGNLKVIPVPVMHGSLEASGCLFIEEINGVKKSIAYLTDCSFIEKTSLDLIKENCGTLEHLIIDGLRKEPHSTHFSFKQAMDAAEYLAPENTWFIHMTHNMSHEETKSYIINELLPDYPVLKSRYNAGKSVAPAYDTQEIHT